jgi:HTH-type transcriptional regulator, quorum sensing regulator NprR
MQIGKNIREYRKQLGLTQSQLAAGLFTVQTMSLIERGKLAASPQTMSVLAERLNCTVDDLLLMHDLQEDWLEELLQTAQRFQQSGQDAKAIEILHTTYTESYSKNNTRYMLESSYQLCLLYHKSAKHHTSSDWGQTALGLLDPQSELDRILAVYSTLGNNHYILGQIWTAFELLQEAEKLVDQYQHGSEQVGRLYYTMAILKQVLRNSEGCIWYSTRALSIFEQHDMVVFIGRTLMMLGISYRNLGRNEKAYQHLERSIRLLSQTSDHVSLARSYHNLGDLDLHTKQHDKARKHFVRAMNLFRQAKDMHALVHTLRSLAQLSIELENLDEAEHFLTECRELANKSASELQRTITIRHQGYLALKKGDKETFISCYKQAIERFEQLKYSTELAESAEKLAEFYLEQGQPMQAVPYLRLANEHFRKLLKKS